MTTITILPSTLANSSVSATYSQTLSSTGGTSPYTYQVTANALPAGLGLYPDGNIYGTLIQANTSNFTITSTDFNGNTGTHDYSITVAPPTIVISPPSLTTATTNVAYSKVLAAAGSYGPYTYAVSANSLPAGFTLSSSGVLSGTGSSVESSTFTVTATDAFGYTGTHDYTLSVQGIIEPASLSSTKEGNFYTATFSTVGGVAPYTYSIYQGELPPGITLAGNIISGTPSAYGQYNWVLESRDHDGNIIHKPYVLMVEKSPNIYINPLTLPRATQSHTYSVNLTAVNGTAPYTYAITSGTLPAGLTINASTGDITGTPTGSGYSNFTVTATDANSFTGIAHYTLPVAPYTPTSSSAVRVYVGGILQTSGYHVPTVNPVQVILDVPPPANVEVTVGVIQGSSWYQPGIITPSDGVPLQQTNTAPARFLRGL